MLKVKMIITACIAGLLIETLDVISTSGNWLASTEMI